MGPAGQEIGRGESECQGYLPCGYPASTPLPRPGANTNKTIRGGDIRIFHIRLNGATSVEEIDVVVGPPLPKMRGLAVRGAQSLREAVILRPSFLQHFDTVVMDHLYLGYSSVGTSNKDQWACDASPATLKSDAYWLSSNGPGPNGLAVVADLTALLAPYTMCQIDEDPGNIESDSPPPDTLNTSKRVLSGALERAALAGAHAVIMSLHMTTVQDDEPNDRQNSTKQLAQFVTSVRWLVDRAATLDITVHMRHTCGMGGFPLPANGLAQMLAFVKRCERTNLRVAASLAALECGPASEASAVQVLALLRSPGNAALVGSLLLSMAQQDIMGGTVTTNGRLSDPGANVTQSRALVAAVQKGAGRPLPMWLDGWMETPDEEFAEAMAMVAVLWRPGQTQAV